MASTPFSQIPELRAAVDDELHAVEVDLERARALVQDACLKMQETFIGLDKASKSQQSSYSKLLESEENDKHQGRDHKRRMVDEVGSVLHEVMDTIERTRGRNEQVDASVAALNQRLESTSQILLRLETISSQSELLALNAAIEAAHHGESSKGFAVVADEMKSLSSDSKKLNREVTGYVDHAMRALEQVKGILREINEVDMAKVERDRGNVDDALARMRDFDAGVRDQLKWASNASADIAAYVSVAIRSLQFEDLVNQVLALSGTRMQRLTKVNRSMSRAMHELAELVGDKAQPILDRLRAETAPETAELHRSVEQTGMDAGHLELF